VKEIINLQVRLSSDKLSWEQQHLAFHKYAMLTKLIWHCIFSAVIGTKLLDQPIRNCLAFILRTGLWDWAITSREAASGLLTLNVDSRPGKTRPHSFLLVPNTSVT
jgi:hypothetical protein